MLHATRAVCAILSVPEPSHLDALNDRIAAAGKELGDG
jgi:hypothetical protein